MKIRYAQIGVGHPHANKISVYRESEDFDVIAVAEPDADLRQAAASEVAFRGLAWQSIDQILLAPPLKHRHIDYDLHKFFRSAI